MKRAGAGGKSANRITLLRDANGDGFAETRTIFLEGGLNSPFGMVLIGEELYVANSDALVSFAYRTGDTQITTPGIKVIDLPAGPINHHWTKNVLASQDGSFLYITVGWTGNVGENGAENEINRAAIWVPSHEFPSNCIVSRQTAFLTVWLKRFIWLGKRSSRCVIRFLDPDLRVCTAEKGEHEVKWTHESRQECI